MTREQELREELFQTIRVANKNKPKIGLKIFSRMVNDDHRWLPKIKNLIMQDITTGLMDLIDAGLEQHTLEYIILNNPEYRKLFSSQYIEKCEDNLKQAKSKSNTPVI